ncbi:glycoside hydrolase family 2 protein [Vallitalea pronyensis]|uniref:Glycoside hydrolase family 2 protein n=1 Tax=Vallitalea pronyensis TaxID=1348613 RepID=A0A8J8MIV5_9FIRM|nr:glycoside hydrolase family 2 protein [Vallitalea pronyensis]QUI22449.1 glycoside hydrolase family 2 protein [Vallitalea pronyensis]
MREKLRLNNNWQYIPNYIEGMEKVKQWQSYELVHLPHSNIELPYHYFDEKLYQFISCYRLPIQVDKKYTHKIGILRFEGVMAYAKVFVNGDYIGEHKGGYTPFEFDISHALVFGKENMLTVIVDATEREDIPPFGGQIDYLTYGGIYRQVSLTFYDKLYIQNAQIKTNKLYQDKKELEIDVYTHNQTALETVGEFKLVMTDDHNHVVYEGNKQLDIGKDIQKGHLVFEDITDIQLWDIHNPKLYTVSLTLLGDTYEDTFTTKIGFRECKFKEDGFYLNNKKIKLMGLNRHQSYPYNGYAMPKRVQEKDADILKHECHVNLVRTAHYPQSVHFLNRCDEIGLLVFEEIPGWQHIGDEAWQKIAINHVGEMIQRDWNHPSIILWGVRINESMDNDAFYQQTNDAAKLYDTTRQTGGVRCIENSALLEDVYTMNDFVHDGHDMVLRNQQDVTHLDHQVPYLVTEYNGHMYPTKKFDQEERQMEHVLRHLRVQNASYAMDNVSGAIGWCAFDYNTHKDFGSGDKICYHGVMDMFRTKKFAAYAYGSQVSPDVEPVLQPVTFWARGERSIGGVLPLVILTNCDYIEFKYGDFPAKKIYPSKSMFESLPYPPVIIDETIINPSEIGEWGMLWEDCDIIGFVDNKKVIEKKLAKSPLPTDLRIQADDSTLHAEEKDATRIVIEALDQYGNLMPFYNECIHLDLTGVGRIIGPEVLTLVGGSIAFWVETVNKKGSIDIHVSSMHFDKQTLSITVQ